MVLYEEYEHIMIKQDDGVLTVELNRPDVHNAFNDIMIAEITGAFEQMKVENEGSPTQKGGVSPLLIDEDLQGYEPLLNSSQSNTINSSDLCIHKSKDYGIRDWGLFNNVLAVVVTGSGRSFCAGADLNWMKRMAGYSREENIEDARKMARMFQAIEECPFPTIARVNGAAFGGGVGLVAVCDFAFAPADARFSFSETNLGMVPAVISKWVIERIGTKKAKQLFMTGERFDSAMACDIGLIDGSVHDLDGTIDRVVAQFGTSGPMSIMESKKLVNKHSDDSGYLDSSIYLIADLRASDEGREGIAAFLEKRKPAWRRDGDV